MIPPYSLLAPDGNALQAPQTAPGASTQPAPSAAAQPTPGLLSRIRAAIEDRLFSGAAPSSLAGLLTPDDIAAARRNSMTHLGLSLLANSEGAPGRPAPNALAAIGQAGLGAQQDYAQAVQNDVGGQETAMQMAQAKRLEALRNRLGTQYPQQPGETPEQQLQRIEQLAVEYANGGDPDTAGKLAQLAKAIRDSRQSSKPTAVQYGTGVTTYDPTALGGKGGFWDPTLNNGQGGYAPSINRGLSSDQLQENAQNRTLRGLQIQNAQDALSQRQMQSIATAFDHSVSPLATHLTSISQAEALVQQAQSDPSAWGPAVSNFIQATDAKPQLRMQLLQYLGGQVGGPSLVQKARLMIDEHISGAFDPKIAAAMLAVLANERNVSLANYDRRRAGVLSRHKGLVGLEDWLTPSSDVYQSPNGTPTGAAPTLAPPQAGNPFRQ